MSTLSFAPPISHVYNPVVYAWTSHRRYLETYGAGVREVILLGMNPGPWGMSQTGVPFGDAAMVRGWMGIEEAVGHPDPEHPKRPVRGFACPRSEVSGTRLWGWARDRFGTPDRFFARFFVANYCPLAFIEDSGRNFTPDKLPAAERAPLEAACDQALRELVDTMQPRYLIGIGRFAEKRLHAVFPEFDGVIGAIPHPSPANPAANRDWPGAVEAALEALVLGLGSGA